MGIEPSEYDVILAIQRSFWQPGRWVSLSQTELARRRGGIHRTTLNKNISSLRRKGLIAVREDPRFRRGPRRQCTFFYCLDPYLSVLAWLASEVEQADLAERLRTEAVDRLERFLERVRKGRWTWELDGVQSAPETASWLAETFARRHRLQLPIVANGDGLCVDAHK